MNSVDLQGALSGKLDANLSLCNLLEPGILADPYPLYHRLQQEDPVHWDPFLHAWVVTDYADVVAVLNEFSANCAPTPEQLTAMGLPHMNPIAEVMLRQMLFMDPPAHTRLRALACQAFTPRRVEALRSHIQEIVNKLLEDVLSVGCMDVMKDIADPLPAIVTAELLGLPVADHRQLKAWSTDFAEILGNFQHNTDRASRMLQTLEEMVGYFRTAIKRHRHDPEDCLIDALLNTKIEGEWISDDVIIANCILLMVGGQETTPNLIGNGMLSLLRNPEELHRLRMDLSLMSSAVEEFLRYESPSQHTTRLAFQDVELGGKKIRKRQAVIVVIGAANRDPKKFLDPDRFDITRKDNRHLAFGGGAHFCFGAPLARLEAQIAFETILRRIPQLELATSSLTWRANLGLRGLTALPVRFEPPTWQRISSKRESRFSEGRGAL
jgi:cytochrome P450